MIKKYVLVRDYDHPYIDPCDYWDKGTTESQRWESIQYTETIGDIEKYRPYLSGREFEIAQLISESYSPSKVAKELGISRRRVRNATKEIRRKLWALRQKTSL